MSDKMRCPHNAGQACVKEDYPISANEDESEIYQCSGSPCAYIAELNYKEETKIQTENIGQQLDWIRNNIGATEDDDNSIATILELIRQQLDWIRENLGSVDDDDETIYGILNEILNELPTEESVNNISATLSSALKQLEDINTSTYRY